MTLALDPSTFDDADRDNLVRAAQAFARHSGTPSQIQIVDHGEETVLVPRQVAELMSEILSQLSAGRIVAAFPVHAELTTQQAADLLNVSRPHLVQLLEEGRIRFHRVGTHRRIVFRDLMSYKNERDAESRASLDELTQLSQELGEYDD